MTVEGEDGIRIRGLDVVELDRVVAGRSKVALVGGYAEPVHLGVGMGDGAGADARKGFPEALRVQSARGASVKTARIGMRTG